MTVEMIETQAIKEKGQRCQSNLMTCIDHQTEDRAIIYLRLPVRYEIRK